MMVLTSCLAAASLAHARPPPGSASGSVPGTWPVAQASPASPVAPAASAAAMREADRAFVLEAAASALLLVEASRRVEQRAENPLVKAHAAMLVKDQGLALEQLRQLARARGLTLPDTAPPERLAAVEGLQALPPEEMAQRYVQQLVLPGHEADLKLYQAMAASAGDPELVAWPRQALPLLQAQLQAARRLPVTVQAGRPPPPRQG